MGWASRVARLQVILAVIALGVPLVAGFAIGMGALWQMGLLWVFALGSLALVALTTALRWILRRRLRSQPAPQAELPPDPVWSASETQAYAAAQAVIARNLSEPLPWDALPPVIETLVAQVAAASGRQGKGIWDFTLPEALLLVNRVSDRLRGDMRRLVPFADTVSVRSMIWIWRNRDGLQTAATIGQGIWRAQRLLVNPPAAILRELERQLSGAHTEVLTAEGLRAVQRLLLEEIAQAAIDLYSGRLKFSDAELAGVVDQVAEAAPDRPIRIAVAGQVSAGKSTLINALAGADGAETDILPTTPDLRLYPMRLAGHAVELMDMPGLDGSKAAQDSCLADLDRADLVLWVMRADRPGRDVDHQALAAWDQAQARDPARRVPQILPVVTAVDRLLPGWPFVEHQLPEHAQALLADLQKAVSQDLPQGGSPLLVAANDPAWNIAAVTKAIADAAPRALQTQRNRLRLAATAQSGGIAQEALRAGRGLRAAAFRVFRDGS